MENNMVKTPQKNPVQSENTTTTTTTNTINSTTLDYKTPPPRMNEKTSQVSPISGNIDCQKSGTTPDRLRVPKAFKYPERYTSPTDLIMSPISRGLLARSRKGGATALLPPSIINQPKIQDLRVQDVGVLQI